MGYIPLISKRSLSLLLLSNLVCGAIGIHCTEIESVCVCLCGEDNENIKWVHDDDNGNLNSLYIDIKYRADD